MKTGKLKRRTRRTPWRSLLKSNKGQTLVEFSLAIPIFLLLSLILLDGGRAYFVNQVLLNAAREGARMGSMGDVPPTAVVSAITNTMNAGGYKTWKAAYSNLGTNGAPGSITTVQLAVNFQTLTGTFIPGWTGSLPISQTIRMRHE
jgi:Flp pilus assembly protein TadG